MSKTWASAIGFFTLNKVLKYIFQEACAFWGGGGINEHYIPQ